MATVTDMHGSGNGPKFHLNIEGREIPWDRPTITTEEVIRLGGWDAAGGALMVDADGNETTLQPGATIDLRPGLGFFKKVKFRRGGAAR